MTSLGFILLNLANVHSGELGNSQLTASEVNRRNGIDVVKIWDLDYFDPEI